MCGIFGAVNTRGYCDSQDFDRFVALTNRASHRGPDASGFMGFDFKGGGGQSRSRFDVFLGSRRLSIIDLSAAANQPMRGQQNRWLIFNGEIFNYKELRQEFEIRYPFRTVSDTEVILAAYELSGAKKFADFNGEWAFAIADFVRGELVLSRDRFSIKPLYYYNAAGIWYFASEIKQLLPLLPVRSVEPEIVGLYLRQGLIDTSEKTFFRSIFQLPAKHNMTVSLRDGTATKQQYWDYDLKSSATSLGSAVEEFRNLFRSSVEMRLRSDVTVGTLLSGGLDSSSISVTANEVQRGQLETYSVVSTDPKYSEGRFVEILVKESGLKNRLLFTGDSKIAANIEATIQASDEPPGGFSAIAHYTMMQAIRSGSDIKVMLSGQGGDEVLLGYRKFFFFMLQSMIMRRAVGSFVREIVGSLVNRTAMWDFHWGEAQRYVGTSQRKSHSYVTIPAEMVELRRGTNMAQRQISDLDLYSVPNLTHYEDRNSSAFGMEVRLPFLDYRLVNFCLNLDETLKIHNGWSKYVLRECMAELPDAIRWRRDKKGFSIPEIAWLKTKFVDKIRGSFQQSALEKLGLLDSKAFLRYYEDFRQGSRIWSTDISRALLAEVWARMYFLPDSVTEDQPSGDVVALMTD